MAKIVDPNKPHVKQKAKTRQDADPKLQFSKWWEVDGKAARANAIYATANFLRSNQQYRYRQSSIFARLYSNLPVSSWFGTMNKMATGPSMPTDRPTFNLVQACVDTLNSRLTQARPRPYFLTDGGDWKKRQLAKRLNEFSYGEFHSINAYALGEQVLRDASVFGTGCLKVYKKNGRCTAERTLLTDLLVDEVDAMFGKPTQMMQLMLVDRSRLADMFPNKRAEIMAAPSGTFDGSSQSQDSIADTVIAVEAWHLRSGPDAKDGSHAIAIPGVMLLDEQEAALDKFPFVFLHYAPRALGFWAQGLAEQLMGTQIELNRLLITTSRAINLIGVPRVFVEDGSAVVKAHLNNDVGTIVTYRGTKPIYEVAPCMPQEVYAQMERLIQYGFQQSGVSMLSATSAKPAGLNSGEAIRNYDDLQTDRFNTLAKRYEQFFLDLDYHLIEQAKEIQDEEGSYTTRSPGKGGIKAIELPKDFDKDDYIIECYAVSSLPKDPAGRLQKVTEMMQAGILSPQEGRRLLDFPDLEQIEKLANAPEERIYKVLDEIVENGKQAILDGTYNLQLAKQCVLQYINLYAQLKLSDDRMMMLNDFSSRVDELLQMATPPPMPAGPAGAPMAVPQAPPTSDTLPINPQ